MSKVAVVSREIDRTDHFPVTSHSKLMSVNFGGVLNGTQAFVDRMVSQDSPAAVVITGSKQGSHESRSIEIPVTKLALLRAHRHHESSW